LDDLTRKSDFMGARIDNPLYQDTLMPVGSIVAWAKGLAGIPALTGVWKECDGTTYGAITTPDLRNNAWIFGSTTASLVANTNSAPNHYHTLNYYNSGATASLTAVASAPDTNNTTWVQNPTGTAGNSFQMVYIMRVA